MFSGGFGVLIGLVLLALGVLIAIFGGRMKFRSPSGSEASPRTAARFRWGIAAGLALFGLFLGSNSAVTLATSRTVSAQCQIGGISYHPGGSGRHSGSIYWIVSTSCGVLRDDFRPAALPGRTYTITYVTSSSLLGPNQPRVIAYR